MAIGAFYSGRKNWRGADLLGGQNEAGSQLDSQCGSQSEMTLCIIS